MITKKSFLSVLIFSLFSVGTPTNATALSHRTKTIGGCTLVVAGSIGTWYCYKKRQACVKRIEKLEQDDLNNENDNDEEEIDNSSVIKKTENNRDFWEKCAWIAGSFAAIGAGIAAFEGWEWYLDSRDLPIGKKVEIYPGVEITADEDGYTIERDDGVTGHVSNQEVEKLPELLSKASSEQLRSWQANLGFTSHKTPRNVFSKESVIVTKEIKRSMKKLQNGDSLNRRDKFLLRDAAGMLALSPITQGYFFK